MSSNKKHALITGASRGIGRGIALKLAENDVNVAVHYYRNESAAKTSSGIGTCVAGLQWGGLERPKMLATWWRFSVLSRPVG